MPRLRQQNASNYVSSANISAEFENLVRYLNRTELGDKTLGELIAILFDEDGEFAGPIEFQLDPTEGLQWRVGSYTDQTAGWQTIVEISEIRGPSGSNVGTIGAPVIFNRQSYTATAGQTDFPYAFDAEDDLLVYDNGILLTPAVDYTKGANVVTFLVGRTLGHTITIYSIRASQIIGYTRSDTLTVAPQAVFPFIHDEFTALQVYKNGILQREGGSYDYTTNPASDTVTFTSTVAAGNLVSILTVQNTSEVAVTGLMMEADYSDLTTGLIRYDKIAIADDQIPQAKVNSLITDLGKTAKLIVSNTTPTGEWLTTGRQWLDTSVTPNVLRFYNGVNWLATSPESALPPFTPDDAGKYVRINGTGTSYVYDDIDLSSVIAITQKGASNGVASLDANGKLPTNQLPEKLGARSIYYSKAGAQANATITISRIFKEKLKVTGMSIQCSAGTCTAQFAVNGVAVGTTVSVTSAGVETTFATAQSIDASITNSRLGVIITGASSLADLEVTLSTEVLA